MVGESGWLRYECREGKSEKFWEVLREGRAFTVRYGRIGAKGREQRKEFDSEAACAEAVQKKIEEKKRKGYQGSGPPPSTLWKAVEKSDEKAVRKHLAAGADPDECRDGVCLLEHSFQWRRAPISLALIEAGADLRQLSSSALNPVWAVRSGRAQVVRAFLEAGARVNCEAVMGSPLRVAARQGYAEIVKVLIDAGADLNSGGMMDTPLFAAVEEGQEECARLLVEAGASLDPAKSGGRSVVGHAAKAGMGEVLRALVAAGADLECRCSFQDVDQAGLKESLSGALDGMLDSAAGGEGGVFSLNLSDHVSTPYEGVTPLMVAAGEGHADCVEILIEAGAQLDALDERGQSAVHHARGHANITERLVAAGANPEAKAPSEQRLRLAAETGEQAELRLALADGADVDAPDSREQQLGRTALMLAAAGGHLSALETLLAAGADVNRADDHGEDRPRRPGAFWMRDDSRGRTALMLAAEGGHGELVEQLLVAGADPSHADAEKGTALTLAAGGGHGEAVRALLAAGADPNQRGSGRRTPLHASLENGGEAVAGILIDAGTKLDVKNGDGEAALHLAALMGLRDIVRHLLEAGANPTLKNRSGELPRKMADEKETVRMLREAEQRWVTEGRTAPEPVDEELERARAARARAPTVSAPSVRNLEKAYAPEVVLPRLQSAGESELFRALLPEIAAACGGEPEDQRTNLGGYRFDVPAEHLDDDGLLELQENMLARGAYVCGCGRSSTVDGPSQLLVLPTEDRYDAVAVIGTNGCNEDKSTADILRWLMQREQTHPFQLLRVAHDTLAGRFEEPIEDPEELAQSMYDLCSDIVDQGCESVEALAQSVAETGQLYFWWD